MAYAQNTSIPIEKTRAEIERFMLKRGAGQFMSAIDQENARSITGWTMEGRMVRITLNLPDPKDHRFNRRRTRWGWSDADLPADRKRELYEQACRARFRALLLIIKAKFEAIDAGLSTSEKEFFADTVTADGSTVFEAVTPALEEMYRTGRMPKLLGA